MGRLFDAVSSLLGCCQRVTFEAQAAAQLEFLAMPASTPAGGLAFALDGRWIDPAPVLRGIVEGLRGGADRGALALGFHHAVADAIVAVAVAVAVSGTRPVPAVGLTGGCFQNAVLVELTSARLAECGLEVLTHRMVPPNDGGIALGQVAVAAARHRGAR